MTAKEMFEKLGYEHEAYANSHIRYMKDYDNVFYFYLDEKTVYKSGYYDSLCDDITMKELQAINQQCKELGWLDDE